MITMKRVLYSRANKISRINVLPVFLPQPIGGINSPILIDVSVLQGNAPQLPPSFLFPKTKLTQDFTFVYVATLVFAIAIARIALSACMHRDLFDRDSVRFIFNARLRLNGNISCDSRLIYRRIHRLTSTVVFPDL